MDQPRRTWRPLIMGRRAAVATNHPEATAAGMAMLRSGGNAVDAAAAVSLALGVVEPQNSGLGGDGFSLVRMADTRRGIVFNGSGAAPEAALPAVYASGVPTSGPLTVSTPGSLGGTYAMHEANGRLPWKVICAPAIELADAGFAATAQFRRSVATCLTLVRADINAAETFLVQDEVPALGTLIRQPRLAETLRAIATNGADDFYRGALARTLADDLAAVGALPRLTDLQAFTADVQNAISIDYRGLEILQSPPNSTGFVLLQELKMLEQFDLSGLDPESPELVHLLVEIKKRAFVDRELYGGDPRFSDAPLERLLSDTYAAESAAKISLATADTELRLPAPSGPGNTTYFAVVDSEGNAVSSIQSLNAQFGSGVMGPETGIMLNNRMSNWHLDADHPNALRPGKRVRHTMNTPMVVKDGEVWSVFGTPGADNQVQINLHTATKLIDFDLDPQVIAEAPRWSNNQKGHESAWPHEGSDELILEDSFEAATVAGLRERGHNVRLIPSLEGAGSMQCIRVLDNGVRAAGSDPRRDGWAAAM